ncbi:VVA0879 family protein [Microbispora sp. NPDC049125]|uniref:VVA0879 family protein n=1 Tax=Microbispora sp. NPDC049125 TaxID=3154929 RepID=UPI0034677828
MALNGTVPMSNADWRAEGLRRFGTDNPVEWRFRCVSCGTVYSPADFVELGVEPRRAPHECIGRILAEQGQAGIDGNSKPCNWAANGMFRLQGVVLVEGKDGAPTLVFPFADPPPVPSGT